MFTRVALFIAAVAIGASPWFSLGVRTGSWAAVIILSVFAVGLVWFVGSLLDPSVDGAAPRRRGTARG